MATPLAANHWANGRCKTPCCYAKWYVSCGCFRSPGSLSGTPLYMIFIVFATKNKPFCAEFWQQAPNIHIFRKKKLVGWLVVSNSSSSTPSLNIDLAISAKVLSQGTRKCSNYINLKTNVKSYCAILLGVTIHSCLVGGLSFKILLTYKKTMRGTCKSARSTNPAKSVEDKN